MQTKYDVRRRPGGVARAIGLALGCAACLAAAACLAGTVPVPVQPGAESLPQGNLRAREDLALAQLSMVKKSEDAHFVIHGKFGTIDELMKAGLINQAFQGGQSYTIDVFVTDEGTRYSAIAVPVQYGPTGKRSFFLDETGVIRGADHEGGSATAADPVITPGS